jgi:sugar/nucleoside kinase (ribokinase family)
VLDVCGIGSALVDILVSTTSDVVVGAGLVKGSMMLMGIDEGDRVHALVPGGIERSGGSVANSIAGVAMLGGTSGFIGRVASDRLGSVFADDLASLGVEFNATPVAGTGTGRSLILVTEDADRTMCTTLGVAAQLGPDDLDLGMIGRSAVTYLEGYLWDEPQAKDAFRVAIETAHANGRKAAMSLSDPFCVHRHRDEFAAMVRHDLDIVFGNESELCSLAEVDSLEEACRAVRRPGLVITVTRGAEGSWVLEGGSGEVISVPSEPVGAVVDTTGAGDLYAAGFLRAFTAGRDLGSCARLGNLAAGEVIGHVGPRPEANLVKLIADAGL